MHLHVNPDQTRNALHTTRKTTNRLLLLLLGYDDVFSLSACTLVAEMSNSSGLEVSPPPTAPPWRRMDECAPGGPEDPTEDRRALPRLRLFADHVRVKFNLPLPSGVTGWLPAGSGWGAVPPLPGASFFSQEVPSKDGVGGTDSSIPPPRPPGVLTREWCPPPRPPASMARRRSRSTCVSARCSCNCRSFSSSSRSSRRVSPVRQACVFFPPTVVRMMVLLRSG